jgi:hypothetical protein
LRVLAVYCDISLAPKVDVHRKYLRVVNLLFDPLHHFIHIDWCRDRTRCFPLIAPSILVLITSSHHRAAFRGAQLVKDTVEKAYVVIKVHGVHRMPVREFTMNRGAYSLV